MHGVQQELGDDWRKCYYYWHCSNWDCDFLIVGGRLLSGSGSDQHHYDHDHHYQRNQNHLHRDEDGRVGPWRDSWFFLLGWVVEAVERRSGGDWIDVNWVPRSRPRTKTEWDDFWDHVVLEWILSWFLVVDGFVVVIVWKMTGIIWSESVGTVLGQT